MEVKNTINDDIHELGEDFDDTLSFRNLPVQNPEESEFGSGYRDSISDRDFSFQFSPIACPGDLALTVPTSSSISRDKQLKEKGKHLKKKQRILIGLAKLPKKMELSEIKKRQRQQQPRTMFMLAEDGGGGGGDIGGERGHWSLLGTLRYRSLLLTALTKATNGCIPCHLPVKP